MRYYISFLALGDNLISLSMLTQLNERISIFGTRYTEHIAKLIDVEDDFDIEVVFENIPAFYDIRKQGTARAIKDFFIFVRYIKNSNAEELIFEKKDFRSFLISYFTKIKACYPNNYNSKVYQNRKNLIDTAYKKIIDVNSYPLKLKNTRKILINPITRVKNKDIKHTHLKYIVGILQKNKYKVYLLDLEGGYKEFEKDVDRYLTNTSLNDVKQLIKECDLYIGSDSFLIHLSYFLKRNFFIIFYRDNNDFLPPNIKKDFFIKASESDNFNMNIREKFVNIGLIK